jgi:RNA polymerase sigma-70 factor (ECF subfamily)
VPYSSPQASADPDEAALARRIMAVAPARDRDAEGELYRRLAPRVRLYGLKHLRDGSAAADLVQDVLLMTLQRLRAGEIREPERVASFVLGTSRQMVIDRRRGEARRQQILATFAEDLPRSEPPSPASLDIPRLRRCLERLSERERTIVLLSFYDERQAADVGSEVGLSATNVRVIRHRSIERLRVCLDWSDDESGRVR